MKEYLKTFSMYIIKVILSPLKLFKIKKYIMFCSNSGDSFSCNPKYLYLYMNEKSDFKDYTFIWTFKDISKYESFLHKKTLVCKYRSLKYYYYKIVSKFYISNSIEGNETPKKKGQIRIQTWHGGGCYKTVGLAEKNKSGIYKKRTEECIKNTDLFLSSSKIFSDNAITKNFSYRGEILNSGMPRNDIFFDNTKCDEIKKLVRDKLNISNDSYVVLYAPTWRYDETKLEEINFEKITKALEKKYHQKVEVIYRAHLHMSNQKISGLINGSDYSDMQELLIASDMLITDYSSSIWDYSFTYKPCILFCPDLDYYLEKRGFDEDIHTWGFPISTSNEELLNAINNFNTKDYINNMHNHHKHLVSYENGTACESVAKYIKDVINKERI